MQNNIQPIGAPAAASGHPKYRADIDGLRAIAVLSVVGFHAFPNWVKGGFIGVDIFFVISGFLISTIIMGTLERQGFSYADFYGRRIRRIFPALMLVLACCLGLGWFALLADEFSQLGKHTASGTAFISNLVLWSEAGYFDTSAETKPLLHLWSLAIEEQFYIFWPILLGLVWRRKLSFLTITIAIALVSFLINIYVIQTDPVAAFYSPLSRFWELMIGGVLAYLLLHRPEVLGKYPNGQAGVGMALLVVGLLIINKDTPFPSWRALLPCMGAFLLISAGSGAWLNRQVLASRPMVWFGLISYPLYLWHWPALSFAHILEGSTPSAAVRGGAVVFSVVAAYLTYRLIEVRFRNNLNLRAKNVGLVLVALSALGVGLTVFLNQGLPERAITARNAGDAGSGIVYRPSFPAGITGCASNTAIDPVLQPHCHQYVTRPGAPTVALWGDSSSDAWSYVFYKLAEKHGFNVVLISHVSCPPLVGVRKTFHHHPESHKYCADGRLGDTAIQSLKALKPHAVVLIGAWNGYSHYKNERSASNEYITARLDGDADASSSIAAIRSQLPQTITALDGFTNVLVFNSWPKLLEFPNYRINRLPFVQPSARTPLKPAAQHAQESAVVHEVLAGATGSGHTQRTRVFDPAPKVCATVCEMSLQNIGMYADEYHITPYGSTLFESDLWALLGPMVAQHKR